MFSYSLNLLMGTRVHKSNREERKRWDVASHHEIVFWPHNTMVSHQEAQALYHLTRKKPFYL